MKTQRFPNKTYIVYLLKFAGLFCLLYFFTLGVIGLSSPENYYSPVVDHYFNFIRPLRISLLQMAKFILSLLGFDAHLRDGYTLALSSGRAVRMVYSCIGYGVMCFWIAFVAANKGGLTKKISWIFSGLLGLWLINGLRIALLLVALQQNKEINLLGWNHHAWFNLAAYSLIFLMIFLYDRTMSSSSAPSTSVFQ